MSFFTAGNLTVSYGENEVLRGVSFTVEAGQLIGILGANGSGKTTLLKTICNLLPHTGSCMLENVLLRDLSASRLARLCSYIPQRSGISIDLSVMDVVLMGYNPRLRLLEHPGAVMRERASRILTEVGLKGMEEADYLHLSEGQKQLCILARTLVTESRLLLLDEPESALDFEHRYRMLQMLSDWVKKESRAAIVTLHDTNLALNACDRLLLLSRGVISAVLSVSEDSEEEMEQKLHTIYGPVSLQRCRTKSGQEQLVMLKEEE